MLIAVTAMFLQQTCGSIARALPAVLAPLIIAELHANDAWVGIYFSLTAFAGLIGQLGSGGFIIRHGAIRMSQIALLFTGAGLAVAVLGGAVGFVLSALIGNGVASVATPASSQLLGRWSVMRYAPLLAIGAVTMVVSATALSWHGIMLSEAARLAPPGRVGAVTGGVLSFGQIGALSSPAVFSLLLGLSGGYSAGWDLRRTPTTSRNARPPM